MKRYTLLILLAWAALTSQAQITIGGDVYGGGKEGAVCTGNTTTVTYYATADDEVTAGTKKVGDVKTTADKDNVTLKTSSTDATSVTLAEEAVVRTVFGGGRNGRCYGQTNVTVEDGEVGGTKWANTIHGGLFGAGDGSTAYVFGKENSILIKGGTIYNNVYGGGNQADLMGCTSVTLQDGTYYGSVFGGARMANIYGHSFVNLDGANVPTGKTLIIPSVYGGNDISGTISLSDKWNWTTQDNIDISKIPNALQLDDATKYNSVDASWNAFISSTLPTDHANNNVFVGNLFGGGNGDYSDAAYTTGLTMVDTPAQEEVKYTAEDAEVIAGTKTTNDVKTAAVAETTTTFTDLSKPNLGKAFLNLKGGTFGYVYGGGNNATVTGSTDILIWNEQLNASNEHVMASIPESRVSDMGVLASMFTIKDDVATPSYQFDRVFGGNNKAAMSIQPNWYLCAGSFNNIYSGGNKGDMINADGILIGIGSRSVYANNVYGGCRMADVHPKYQTRDNAGDDVTHIGASSKSCLTVQYDADGKVSGMTTPLYDFQEDYAARVYVNEGHINNVYGGNDISGRVYWGSDVVIAGAISGNVYGGGNGSYAYTDKEAKKEDSEYADLYYDPSTASTSVEALNAYRPQTDKTFVDIFGDEDQQPKLSADGTITAVQQDGTSASTFNPVIVTGGVYCGGNSTTVASNTDKGSATLKIGKNVVLNSVYLGSNGENMISQSVLQKYADKDYSTLALTNPSTFAKYMEGCAISIQPSITYDWGTAEDPHTYIGSLFGGGNVGSITYNAPITLNMPAGLIIYDQVVGGCNKADVDASTYNAAFEGGVITANTKTNASSPKITINMASYLEPRELTTTMSTDGFLTAAKLYWDVRNYYGLKYNSADGTYSSDKQSVFFDLEGTKVNYASVPWLPFGANVFGGCYTSGHVAGDIQINISSDLISPTMLSNKNKMSSSVETLCNAPQNWVHLGEYVFASTMSVYGGGYGPKTSIWGNTHINLSGAARVINVLGGADYGTIGCPQTDLHDAHVGNTYVTVNPGMTDYSVVDKNKGVDANDTHLPFNVAKIYGGAYAGTIYGHTELKLNGGSYQQAFGGSCNADIADYTSMYLGGENSSNGYPYIYQYAFGGNDFGGYIGRDGSNNTNTDLLVGTGFGDAIKGYHDFTSTDGKAGYGNKTIRTTRYVEYNSGRIGYQYDSSKSAFDTTTGTGNFFTAKGANRSSLYGGSYGSYDYSLKYVAWDYIKDAHAENLQIDFDPASTTFHYPLAMEYIPTADGVFATNTYVNIPCASTAATDVIQKGILGGGRGIMTQTGIVDANQTYVYLHGAKSRNTDICDDVFGGGYYSIVANTKVDAQSIVTDSIFGGSYGTSAKNLNTDALKNIAYNSTRTEVNIYDGMSNANLEVFGGGGYTGSTETNVNLYGGTAHNIYGGSFNEGYCGTTHVNVPAWTEKDKNGNDVSKSSTASVYAIFGGGYGKDVTLPCDEGQTNVTFSSATAYVKDAIYGGNNDKRAAVQTNIDINVPVKTAADGQLANVYGGGFGESTVCGETNVSLASGAQVNNVYGGGSDGKVYGYYANTTGAPTYYSVATNKHGNWSFTAATTDDSWEGYVTNVTVGGATTRFFNTNIEIAKGATAQNVFGAGYGSNATVCGTTNVELLGGTVVGDGYNNGRIFGGGENGNVRHQAKKEMSSGTGDVLVGNDDASLPANQSNNIYTYTNINGGDVTMAYGGGYLGQVGDNETITGTTIAETRVKIGTQDQTNHYEGKPVVQRSLYGGGYRGAIYGTAKIQMWNGCIGYKFTSGTSDDDVANGLGTYSENLQATASDTHNLLKESGNVFGGGYGEGATTDHTIVNMYDGTIRNSLYGGGEIASVGQAVLSSININDRSKIPNITVAGSTEVNMYGGLVSANVFGGGRGYAVDAYGNTKTGEVGYSDGYTFGKTRVNIYRGTIGTDATLEDGNGNVFGGGNIGYVYGADESLTGTYKNVTKGSDGYYHITGDGGSGLMSEDCKVVVTPACKALVAGKVNGVTYAKGDIIPCTVLDNNLSDWSNDVLGDLDAQGVIIRNAVFAGGNVSAGSSKVYANTKTIYGNATASIIDCLGKDLITLGDDDIGGLYGDGNLTFVDGYRELNITNYGTDYYSLNNELTIEEYNKLNGRERAYFELKYVCLKGYTGTINGVSHTYNENDKISGSDYAKLDADHQSEDYWKLAGFCTLYAGRMMNTIQRADFCGVYGSRMVLKGAQDRVPSVVDYTKYTINRVGELSLNQVHHGIAAINEGSNGNYFGIYNVVNYLGALTSDVDIQSTRYTDSKSYPADATYKTYYSYKDHNLKNRSRNNGTSKNKVSLASGVWLEIVKQLASSTSDTDVYGNYTYKAGDKIYGPITGVVELDLINAATGEGGGYVYALNEHGTRSASNATQTTLTSANAANTSTGKYAAISYKQYNYSDMDSSTKMETTGNFVNGTKRIVDDCYPNNGQWLASVSPTSAAHYWFVRGEYYVYDQYISAYTGAAQSYAESVNVPLTITAEAQGKIQLLNVQQNLNANWTDTQYSGLDSKYKVEGDATCIVINGNTYHKNTPITYWDWAHLTDEERTLFTTNTYVCNVAVNDKDHSKNYTKGQVLTQTEYNTAITNLTDKYLVESDIDAKGFKDGDVISLAQYNTLSDSQKDQCKLATECFNVTNAVTTENGFLLTYDWDNPEKWDDYYIKPDSQDPDDMKMTTEKNGNSEYSSYMLSPTYVCIDSEGTTSLLGQSSYSAGDLIDATTHAAEPTGDVSSYTSNAQATFEQAYVAKAACKLTVNDIEYNYVKGSAISSSFYGNLDATQKLNFEIGYTCTQTYQVSDDKYYINGDIITAAEYNALPAAARTANFSTVYVCTKAGAWGGKLYTGGKNYQALDYCSLSASERAHFKYNLDAFETLIANSTTQDYSDVTNYTTSAAYQGLDNYDARHTNLYAAKTSIDYTAVYNGGDNGTSTLTLSNNITVTRGNAKVSTNVLQKNDIITREDFEGTLRNERSHYSTINVRSTDTGDYYVVNSEFWLGDTWYAAGSTITKDAYDGLDTNNKKLVTKVDGTTLRNGVETGKLVTYYFCKESYTAITAANDINSTSHAVGSTIDKGVVLNATTYKSLVNEQQNFDINGVVPTETSTLYVARETNIDDLNEDKIVTVIYEYSYIESNDDGTAYENVKERHIINIHLQFESGVPTVGELLTPPAVLPGDAVGLNQPSVSRGAYEILGGGWEIYTNDQDAQTHKNGEEYVNNNTKMYWYQNGYQVAYYAKSYLGKTYSNSVPITVANYHRMDEVMSSTHTETDDGGNTSTVHDYMYLDEAAKNNSLRNAKVYINSKDELDGLAQLYEKTKGGSTGFENIANCRRLDFILDGDVDHTGTDWTSIGESGNCFDGTFHGDGHTISGLTSSLFNHFCGDIYNTGVAGSYTTAGIANYLDGKAVNCWTATTGTIPADTYYPIAGDGHGIVTNCYYYDKNAYKTTAVSGWTVYPKDIKSFVDGEVAFNLNSYYLGKRYYDGSESTSGSSYQYWPVETIGTATPTLATAYYADGYDKYVEIRYGNEDFIYADGTIPVSDNIRKKLASYYPIYPDDYIFFGQNLTYGLKALGTTVAHVNHPEAVNRVTSSTDESLNTKLLATDVDKANRVYRAPAYYKSKVMSVAYFNKPAGFAGTYTLPTTNIYNATGSVDVYKNLTAIDFTGYNDAININKSSYYTLAGSQDAFYKPFLDYEGITKFATSGVTRNLLVYDDPAHDSSSYAVLDKALPEATLTVNKSNKYNEVDALTIQEANKVYGHLVDLTNYTKPADATTVYASASRNHYLVDKEVFNCPISYTFGDVVTRAAVEKNTGAKYYMWYQRTPSNFVDASTGWEAISLPFTADLVSTQTKGEITHFYKKSESSTYEKGYDSGHEYWLREFKGQGTAPDDADSKIFYAAFNYPVADARADTKTDANTFLWDYYYNANNNTEGVDKDENKDLYPSVDPASADKTYKYYADSRDYPNYPFYTAAVPYIIGFPGSRYYEFDLSGTFVPANREKTIDDNIASQVISFVSLDNATIKVSDDELTHVSVSADGYDYDYVPNYMDNDVEDGSFVLNTNGSRFDKTSGGQAVPFRPYFTRTPSSQGAKTRAIGGEVESIYISSASFNKGAAEAEESLDGQLAIFTVPGEIVIESGLDTDKTVTIHTVSGMLVKTLNVASGERVSVSVQPNQIYIVNNTKLYVSPK